jgi:hypothetical protein
MKGCHPRGPHLADIQAKDYLQMSLSRKADRALVFLVILAFLAATVVLLSISFLPYSYLKPQLAALSPHGNATSFTPDMHSRIVISLRLFSLLPLFLAALVFLFRRRVPIHAFSLLRSFAALFSSLSTALIETIKKESRVHLWALAAIFVTACAIRVSFLFQPMRYDEAYTFTHYASTPFYLALSNYSAPNNHLFHTFLVRIAYLILGSDPWVLRLPALIAGILVVPASYLVVRVFFNRHAALLAAGLVASSSALIEFSTNARGYSLICLFVLLTLALSTYLLRNGSPAAWVLFSVLSALGFYAVPTMLYAFGMVVLWLLLSILIHHPSIERASLLRGLLGAVVLTALLTLVFYSPVLLVWGPGGIIGNQFVTSKTWDYVSQSLPSSAWSTWRQWNVNLPDVVEGVLGAGFAASVVFFRRISAYRLPLVVAAIAAIVPIVLVQRVVPYERVWLFLLPLYLGCAAAGIAYVWQFLVPGSASTKSAALALLAVGLSIALSYNVARTQSVYWSEATGTLRDAETITVWMKKNLNPGDMVLAASPSDGVLEYYFWKYNLPTTYYWYSARTPADQVAATRRLVIVVKEPDQSIQDLVGRIGVTATDFTNPTLLQRFPGASLYDMTRKGSEQ